MRRRAWGEQRGGLTIEYVAVGGVVVALVAALVVAIPNVAGPTRDAISTFLCRIVSLVTDQGCPQTGSGSDGGDGGGAAPMLAGGGGGPGDDGPGDVGGNVGGDVGGDVGGTLATGDAIPGLDECITSIQENINVLNLELKSPWGLGARGTGMYWVFKQERADGMWSVTPIWYGDIGGFAGIPAANQFAGLYGYHGPTWIVESEEEADAIIADQRWRPLDYLDTLGEIGVYMANPLSGAGDVVDDVVGWITGTHEDDLGQAAQTYADAGITAGFNFDSVNGSGLDLDLGGWTGLRILNDNVAGERIYYASLSGEGRVRLEAPLLELGVSVNAQGEIVRRAGVDVGENAHGEIALRVGLVQDKETGEFTHVDINYWLQGTVGLSAGGGGGPVSGRGDRSVGGRRFTVTARLPLDDLDPDARRQVIDWVWNLLRAGSPGDIETALDQSELGEHFDSATNARIVSQVYDTEMYRLEGNIDPKTFGIDPRVERRNHQLTDAAFWVEGVGWVDWTECHA